MIRKLLWLLASLLLGQVQLAEAQQPKIPKIGWLAEQVGSGREIFRRELHELGYVEGKNIAYEYRYGGNDLARLSALADELVRLQVDVILVNGTTPAVAAKNATRTIPIVLLNVADPVGAGLIDSLPRPGGNVTGVTSISAVLAGKRLELLKESIRNLSQVAILWDPRDSSGTQQWKESQLAAPELGLHLHSVELPSADKYETAFKEANKAGNAALKVTTSPALTGDQKLITELAIKIRLPAIGAGADYVESGGLMSYGQDRVEPYRRATLYVDKILKGAKPADLPVEQPTKFELVINLKTAKQIGLTIPPNVLARADRVIK
jgi:putative tryptophan/tyrosine transport system substrate-binding protein